MSQGSLPTIKQNFKIFIKTDYREPRGQNDDFKVTRI